jgi:hypothetical protein
MVGQENYGHGMTRLSGVRAIQIKGQRFQGRLQFGLRNPTMVAHGEPINISIQIDNTSADPIRLFFPTPHHFDVVISHLHLIGQDEHIWSASMISAQVIDIINIPPHQSYKEVVTWPQVDMHNRPVDAGEYFVRVHCTADDFHVEGKEGFVITG